MACRLKKNDPMYPAQPTVRYQPVNGYDASAGSVTRCKAILIRDNQSRNQRAWLDRHPEYWRNYREANPEYGKRNKSRQRSKHDLQQKVDLAKMDVLQVMVQRPWLYRIEQIPSGEAV